MVDFGKQQDSHWIDWAWHQLLWLERHRLAKSVELAMIIIICWFVYA